MVHTYDSVLTPQFARAAVRRAMSRSGSASWEEDIAQDALLRGVVAFRRIDQIRSPEALFLKIVNDAVRDHWRRSRITVDLNPLSPDRSLWCFTAEDRLYRSELLDQVRRAFGALSHDQREIMELFYFEELSIEELFRRTGRSRSALKMTLLRGRRRVMKVLELEVSVFRKTIKED